MWLRKRLKTEKVMILEAFDDEEFVGVVSDLDGDDYVDDFNKDLDEDEDE